MDSLTDARNGLQNMQGSALRRDPKKRKTHFFLRATAVRFTSGHFGSIDRYLEGVNQEVNATHQLNPSLADVDDFAAREIRQVSENVDMNLFDPALNPSPTSF